MNVVADTQTDLRYYSDAQPGISRHRRGRGFSYVDADGNRVDCAAERARIAALAIPPAYDDVWISPYADGHLLATGRDEKGRKQYLYHEDWRAQREREKFTCLASVGRALPQLRRWIARHLSGDIHDHTTAIAAALALIERGSLRPGNAAYTRTNASYGATTLRASHIICDRAAIDLKFRAKGGKQVEKRVQGKRLAQALSAYKDADGVPAIAWRSKGGVARGVQPSELNDVFSDMCGDTASVKDLRTWNGSLAAFRQAHGAERLTKRSMAKAAAETLQNTPAIAQKSYVHPDVMELASLPADERTNRLALEVKAPQRGYRVGEEELLVFLDQV